MTYPEMKIHLYLDGADKGTMLSHYKEGNVQGFTTNPSLMRKAGVRDYGAFAKEMLSTITDKPISFEVFADDFTEMEAQAERIHSWAPNVNVKIPISNTKGEMSYPLIKKLFAKGIKLNITAIFTQEQLLDLKNIMNPNDDAIVSIFAGRIADTGKDPMPLMKESVALFQDLPKAKILWASTREALNMYQAQECGCHIITVPEGILKKLSLYNKSLSDYSLETVHLFYEDGKSAGFQL